MDAFLSQLPKLCLSREDEEYLRRNENLVDSWTFDSLYFWCIFSLFIIGFYISHLKQEWKKTKFNLYIEIFHNFGWLIIIPIYIFINNLICIIVKHTVEKIKKRRNQCPKI